MLAALANARPSRLVGAPETSRIDFEIQPYALDTDKGKWELAKDVGGLANKVPFNVNHRIDTETFLTI